METRAEPEWIEKEFKGVDFGDVRLNRRFMLTAKKLANRNESSINEACESWKDAKGAYRMFANEAVQEEEILHSHYESTVERVKKHRRVFAIQDTSFLDFNGHRKTNGLGHIGKTHNEETVGLILHSCLLISRSRSSSRFLKRKDFCKRRADNVQKRASLRYQGQEGKRKRVL